MSSRKRSQKPSERNRRELFRKHRQAGHDGSRPSQSLQPGRRDGLYPAQCPAPESRGEGAGEEVKQDRIQNPSSVERAVIESKIAEGNHVILQFDKPIYSGELLRQINNLCGEFGRQLEVRFYGHYEICFDASVLHSLPDAAALSVDCLTEATNLSALSDLRNLRHLSLGVYRLEEPDFLKRLQLQNLETLCICETAKSNFDLV
jgi:hypothetical protein